MNTQSPPSPSAAEHLRIAIGIAAAIAIVAGASGLVGWFFGIRRLLAIASDAPALMPMSAIALVTAGLALAYAPSHHRFSRGLGAVVGAIAAAAAFGYLTKTDFGFGNLPEGIITGSGTLPGLPAPNSIFAFGFLSAALIVMQRAPAMAQGLALLAATIAYLAGLGELFGASVVRGLSAYTTMSPQTVMGMCALATGILCATPSAGLMPILMDRGAAGLAVRRFLPVAILLPVVLGGLRIAGELEGLFDTQFGTALMAVASAALAGILTVDIAIAIRQLDQKLGTEHRAREVAESESRVKDDVLSLLTGELRTPAGVIHAQAHLLQAGVLTNEKMQQVIETVSRNAARLRQYIDDAADVAAMAQGGILFEPAEIDPREPIRRALDAWAPQIAAKRIAVTAHLMPVGFVQGDAVRLQQIASNLLSNAVKFTPPGGEIRVETARDGDLVRFTVADTGCGIPPEFLPHIFEPFRRSSRLLHEPPEGLGLGLTLVRHLTELHRGTVTAYSDGPGRGARFVVQLTTT
ncbi:MAG TPA: HAMP domain-containing sensor histidine kinase [Vicinamibacterales bacterium]|jgi:signal transduction histidine kinase